MKNIQTIHADLDAKELFEQINPMGAEPRRAGHVAGAGRVAVSEQELGTAAQDTQEALPESKCRGELNVKPADSISSVNASPTAPYPISPSALPFGGDTGEANNLGRGHASSLFLIDVRPRFNWKEFRKGFYVSGLFIALVALACFLILSPFARWCEKLVTGGLP